MSPSVAELADALTPSALFTDGDWIETKDQDPGGDVRLIQLADIGIGRYLDRSSRFLTTATAEKLGCTYLEPGDVLVARLPDPIGRACIFPGDEKPSVTAVDVCIIRPNPETHDARWLMHFLNSPVALTQIARQATGSTRQRISRKNLGRIRIPSVPLAQQRRDAEILDRVDELRARRRSAVSRLAFLKQSIFLDMCGDPRRAGSVGVAPSTQMLLGDVARIRTGKLDANAADHAGAFPFFTCAVKTLRINTFAFDCKAVLVAGNGDLNVKYHEGKFNAYQRTYVIESTDETVLAPRFLYAFLDLYVSHLRQQAIGGVIKYIKLPYLKEAVLQLPPIRWQEKFVDRALAVEKLQKPEGSSLAQLDGLFASFQQRAFRDET